MKYYNRQKKYREGWKKAKDYQCRICLMYTLTPDTSDWLAIELPVTVRISNNTIEERLKTVYICKDCTHRTEVALFRKFLKGDSNV